MWKWVGGLAGLVLLVALSAFAIDAIRRADGRRAANQQDPAEGAGARLATAEPAARQSRDVPQGPGDTSASREPPPPTADRKASSAPTGSARNAPGTLEEATLVLKEARQPEQPESAPGAPQELAAGTTCEVV